MLPLRHHLPPRGDQVALYQVPGGVAHMNEAVGAIRRRAVFSDFIVFHSEYTEGDEHALCMSQSHGRLDFPGGIQPVEKLRFRCDPPHSEGVVKQGVRDVAPSISPAETLQGRGTGRLPSLALQGAEGGFVVDQKHVLGACRHAENMTQERTNVATPPRQEDYRLG